MQFLILALCFSTLAHAVLYNGKECAAHIATMRSMVAVSQPGVQISAEQENVVFSMFSYFGLRTLSDGAKLKPRIIFEKDRILIPPFGENKLGLEIRWSEDPKAEPHVEYTENQNILILPKGYRVTTSNQKSFHNILNNLALGHDLHPYINTDTSRAENVQHGEASFNLKQTQKDAHEAYLKAVEERRRKFLLVAHTGAGKTENLLMMLKHRMKEGLKRGRKLHIVTAEQGALVSQLYNQVEKMQRENGEDFEIVFWESIDGDPSDLAKLKEKVANSKKPIVLVTTAQGLRHAAETSNYGKRYRDNVKFFAENTFSFAFDEANRSGGPMIRRFIENVMTYKGETPSEHSQCFLYGMTATPIRSDDLHVEKELFDGVAYYAGIDDEHTFARRLEGETNNTLLSIYRQLRNAILNGEASPIRLTNVDGSKFTGGADDFYLKIGRDRFAPFMVNPKYYRAIIESLRATYDKHKKVLITAASIDEAELYYRELQKAYPNKKIGISYSNGTSDGYQRQMRKGFEKPSDDPEAINIMVAVKQFDFGVDIPELGAVHVLGKNVGTTTLLQRLGRIIRLNVDKRDVDIILTSSDHQNDIEGQLVLLDLARDSAKRLVEQPYNLSPPPDRVFGQDLSFFELANCAPATVAEIEKLAHAKRTLIEKEFYGSVESFCNKLEKRVKTKLGVNDQLSFKFLADNDLLDAYQYHFSQNRAALIESIKSNKVAEFILNAQGSNVAQRTVLNAEQSMDRDFNPDKESVSEFLRRTDQFYVMSYLIRNKPEEVLQHITREDLRLYVHNYLLPTNNIYHYAKEIEWAYRRYPPPNGLVTWRWLSDNGLARKAQIGLTGGHRALFEASFVNKKARDFALGWTGDVGFSIESMAQEIEAAVAAGAKVTSAWCAENGYTTLLSRSAQSDRPRFLAAFRDLEVRRYMDANYGHGANLRMGVITKLAKDFENAVRDHPIPATGITQAWLKQNDLYHRLTDRCSNAEDRQLLLDQLTSDTTKKYVNNYGWSGSRDRSIEVIAYEIEEAVAGGAELSPSWLSDNGYSTILSRSAKSDRTRFLASFQNPTIQKYMDARYGLDEKLRAKTITKLATDFEEAVRTKPMPKEGINVAWLKQHKLYSRLVAKCADPGDRALLLNELKSTAAKTYVINYGRKGKIDKTIETAAIEIEAAVAEGAELSPAWCIEHNYASVLSRSAQSDRPRFLAAFKNTKIQKYMDEHYGVNADLQVKSIAKLAQDFEDAIKAHPLPKTGIGLFWLTRYKLENRLDAAIADAEEREMLLAGLSSPAAITYVKKRAKEFRSIEDQAVDIEKMLIDQGEVITLSWLRKNGFRYGMTYHFERDPQRALAAFKDPEVVDFMRAHFIHTKMEALAYEIDTKFQTDPPPGGQVTATWLGNIFPRIQPTMKGDPEFLLSKIKEKAARDFLEAWFNQKQKDEAKAKAQK